MSFGKKIFETGRLFRPTLAFVRDIRIDDANWAKPLKRSTAGSTCMVIGNEGLFTTVLSGGMLIKIPWWVFEIYFQPTKMKEEEK